MFDIEAFISALEERPALYDLSNKGYRNRDMKMKLWEEVGEVMYSNWSNLNNKEKNEKGKFMMSKWKSLKDCFNRELREQKKHKSGDSAKNRKQYEYFERLLFLLPNTEKRERPSKISEPQSVNENRNTHGTKRKNSFEENLLTILKNKKTNADEDDCDRLFLLSFLSDMKRLPIRSKHAVKLQFLQAMNQATLGLEIAHQGYNFSQFVGAGSGHPAPTNSNRDYTTRNDVSSPNSTTTDSDVCDMYAIADYI
ncbi:uncharacterized protein LOC143909198 [Arctopsyche grandis]|uniref:uncharacterized protein LOC143909198 n=1 Tax=Arctopsyche grandis TaxID=121162 RepID=UPI00406D815B